MKVKLKEDTNLVRPDAMQDGDIGIIAKWQCCGDEYLGTIVQKYDNKLIIIGGTTMNRWSELGSLSDKSKVRLLKSGDTFQIV